jgi:hypothetical protein
VALGKGITEDGIVAGTNIANIGFAPLVRDCEGRWGWEEPGLGRTSVEQRFIGHRRDVQRKQHHLEVLLGEEPRCIGDVPTLMRCGFVRNLHSQLTAKAMNLGTGEDGIRV